MRLSIPLFMLAILAVAPAHAENTMITKKSSHSVKVTLDRLEVALKEKGIGVAVRWDHAAAAKKVGMSLKPAEVLIFGNPKLGTPLMQSNVRIGLDLPLKVLAWEDEKGQVWVGYTKPDALAARYDIKNQAEVVKKITGALDGLTNQATQP